MSLRDLAASLLVVRIGSNMVPPRRVSEDLGRINDLLDRLPIGGLLLFNGVWPETRAALGALQQKAIDRTGQPLLVMSDIERGVGQQVAGATLFPHALAFDHAADPEAAVRAFVQVKAHEARACGIHVTLGPMADVYRNPDSPIIATRAFSTDPERAAWLARTYVEECLALGLIPCAKHFPGHGGTSEDSHAVVPVVHESRAELDETDLVPFRAVIEAGCPLIMTAHLAALALDPMGRPATRSEAMIEGVLRGELGFKGAVISDSLLMGGARKASGDGSSAETTIAAEAVAAGVDILLDPLDARADVDALLAAVDAGELSEDRLRQAARRVSDLRDGVARHHAETLAVARFGDGDLGLEDHTRVADAIARQALTVVQGTPRLDPETPILAIVVRPTQSHLDPDEQPLAEELRSRFPRVTYAEVGPETSAARLAELRQTASEVALAGEDPKPGDAPRLLIAAVSKPAAWRQAGLPFWQELFIRDLCREAPAVLVALGNPRVLDAFGGCAEQIATYSDVPASQRALAAFLAEHAHAAPAGAPLL